MTSEDSNSIILNKELKNSEKDELDSIFSQNIIETPNKKKCVEYTINSNISYVEIKGIKKNKNKNNDNILFETQINNKRNSKNNKNNNVEKKRTLILPYKKSESVDDLKEIKFANHNRKNTVVLNNNIIKNMKRLTLFNKDKTESAIVNLLNTDKKEKSNKLYNINFA